MDQMTIDEMIVPNDRDDLIIQIEGLTDTLGKMTANYENATMRADRYRSQIKRFEESLRDMLRDGEIDADMAENLSRCFDFTLETEVQVNFTITVSGTATVPLGQDVDDIDWENEVYVDVRGAGDIDLDVYVDSFDAECEVL